MDPSTTIVRVKRKWGTDPADALLLACKRIRPEASAAVSEEIPEPRDEEVENSVFKLVATVATQEALVQTQLRQALFCDKSALRPSADSSQCIIGNLSNTKWSTRQEDCFRLISSHRTALSTPPEQNTLTDISQNVEDIAKKQDRRWGIGEILVVDLEQEQEKSGKQTSTSPERLCVFEDGLGKEHHELEGEYVYDLYYQQTATPDWIHDIQPARVYDGKGQLVPNLGAQEEEVYEELCEYEDNESEENNWKKDYSDEESDDDDDDDDSDREERDGGMSCAAHVFIWPLLTGCVVWLLPGWQF